MAKGGKFERDICKKLSLWWTNDAHDDIFWRTSNSGGRASARARKGKDTRAHHGDICAVDKCGEPFCNLLTLELKRGYNKASVQDLLDKPARAAQQTYEAWFNQAQQASEAAGSFSWLLIVRRDKREALVFMPEELYERLPLDGAFCIALFGGLFPVYGLLLEDFLGVEPQVFKDLVKLY